MLRAISHISVALAVLVVLAHPHAAVAQVPTTVATITGTVTDSSGKPVGDAVVTLSGPKNTSTQTDSHGLFVFTNVAFGLYTISVDSKTLGSASRSNITVQNDTDVAIQYNVSIVNGMKVIANVGTNSSTTFNVGPAPSLTVNPQQAAFNGVSSWRRLLEQIPGVSISIAGNNTSGGIANGPFTPQILSIGGALSYETATLLDGMPVIGRWASTGLGPGDGTDLSQYALNGFGSADIVRGPGAASPSIQGSIGGSLILHAPSIVESNHSEVSISTDPYGGIIANAQTALHAGKFSVALTYGVNDSPGPVNSDALSFDTPGTVNGQYFTCLTALCSGVADYVPGFSSFVLGTFYHSFVECCTPASTAWSVHSGSAALAYNVSPAITASLFYTAQSSQVSGCSPLIQSDVFSPDPGYTGGFPAGYYPSLTDVGIDGSFPEFAASHLLEEKITAQAGRGFLEFAALQNTATFNQIQNYPASSYVQQLFGTGGGLCPTSVPCGSPTPITFNGGFYTIANSFSEYGNLSYYSQNRDLLISYMTPVGQNARVGVSNVSSYYNDAYNEICSFDGSPLTLVQATSPQAFNLTNETRFLFGLNPSAKTSLDISEYIVGVHLHLPNPLGYSAVTGVSPNGWIDSYFHYAAPRLGFVWRPTASVSVRAAAGGGFAVNSLGSYLAKSGATPSCNHGTGICTLTLNNVNLQPETSFAFDLGTDIRMKRNTIFSFDVYRANLQGQVYTAALSTGTYTGTACTTAGGCILYVTQKANLGDSLYEGVLLDLHHDVSQGIYWYLATGLTRGYLVSVPAGFYNTATGTCNFTTGANCRNVTIIPGPNFNGSIGINSIPYAQGTGMLGYRWTPQRFVDLDLTYFGSNNSYYRPAFVEIDGHLGVPLTHNLSLLATFQNITGIYAGSIIALPNTANGIIAQPSLSSAVAGPLPNFPQNYGPRTLLLTMQAKL